MAIREHPLVWQDKVAKHFTYLGPLFVEQRRCRKAGSKVQLAMDRAYKGDNTNQVVQYPRMMPLVSLKENRKAE